MLTYIDNLLNSITMYRLVLYGLLIIAAASILFGFLELLPHNGWEFLASFFVLVWGCYFINLLLAKIIQIPTNAESSAITGLILFCLFTPSLKPTDLLVMVAAAFLAMASKYLLAFRGKHIFNPAAISAVILGLAGSPLVSWWVGSTILTPLVAIIGLLIVRKIRRIQMFLVFVVTSLITISLVFGLGNQMPIPELLLEVITSWPLLFFGTIMLTEPFTSPPQNRLRMIYAAIVGVLFGSQFHFGPVFSTPELALVVGNIFSYAVSPMFRLRLNLKTKSKISPGIYEFSFTPNRSVNFKPGQYLEWTLPLSAADSRGNRRYFTIASSPTEPELHLGIRVFNPGSKFKSVLTSLEPGAQILGSQLAGDFVLPEDNQKKLVFIAGGIGVTPFRSMIKYLIDTNQKREIVMFFSSTHPDDFVYKDLFDQAEKIIGLKVVYVIGDSNNVPANWKGQSGYITPEMIKQFIPDYQNRQYYLSGPNAMVRSYQKMLHQLGINMRSIVTDYFPGF